MAPKLTIRQIPGFSVSAVRAGIKASGKLDLGLIAAARPCAAAALFTQNRVCAAPVKHSRASLKQSGGTVRAILANAGNANCCTGPKGRADAARCAAAVARELGCPPGQVLLASTGIIGEPLPMRSILPGIKSAVGLLESRRPEDQLFAEAIRTLDTHPKEAGAVVELSGGPVRIAGAAKGIGMCAPNMATVLVFLLTDAAVTRPVLQAMLSDTVRETINRVTVDGDTSTNDSCFLLASGEAGNRPLSGAKGRDAAAFREGLFDVCLRLAKMLAADGEGASKFIPVHVTGARTRADAERAARAIAESPLVKTAVCGADPNWGRIMMAIGKSGATVREETARVSVAGRVLFRKGAPTRFDPDAVSKAMRGKEVPVEVDLGLGVHEARIYTCDLTKEYIAINADYHT